ncbi:MAG: thiamine pyrophosphate-binding protein [Synergistales bacterium]|nr:thiamine pyrophosphate-binding protein [Synergistaceae bacterium]MDD4612805.1 thiamine pyrophosphate-binding protein [Synergistaceae bacterium]NCC56570.1 thiamine pyrophosphate-binding protein [Synergistales bacterium]
MKKDLVAFQLVKFLEARGVEKIFGLCGHTVIGFLDALKESSIHFVSVRHEQIAAHAADGYSRGKGCRVPGVLLTHLGPGLANATTGVAEASLNSIPMVVIAGDVPSCYFGRHPHQEVNLHADASQYEIYRPFVKRAWRVDRPELLPEVMDKAFRLAVTGRPGPVLVSIPMDIFSMEIDTRFFDMRIDNDPLLPKPGLDEKTAEKIAKMLAEAKHPILYPGGGVISSGASEALTALATHLEIPVLYTLMGKGAIPDDHPLAVGMTGFWGTDFNNKTAMKADVMMAVGTRLSEADCSSWYFGETFDIPPTRLIHIDINQEEIGRNFKTVIGAVCDAKMALDAILAAAKRLYPNGMKRPETVKEIAETKAAYFASIAEAQKSDQFPMRPERILADLREVFPRNGYIVADVGWNKNGVGQQFPIYEPGTFVAPGGLATMGYGPSAALGVKVACPDKKVVALIGDGGMGANVSPFATAAVEDIAVVWVVMNNCAFGTIAGLENQHYQHQFGTLFEKNGEPYSPDFAAIGEAYGIKGYTVKSASEFKPVLEEALALNKPCVIDVRMENAPVVTEGCWNINDIFRKRGEEKSWRVWAWEEIEPWRMEK